MSKKRFWAGKSGKKLLTEKRVPARMEEHRPVLVSASAGFFGKQKIPVKIYIDGENFRQSLERKLRQLKLLGEYATVEKFDLYAMLRDLVCSNISPVYYFSKVKLPRGYSPDKSTLEVIEFINKRSRYWLGDLRRQGVNMVKAGNLKIKSSKICRNCREQQEILQEKGVDVRLAIDIMEDVYVHRIPRMVILSSDSDICPAVHKIKGKTQVVYMCFEGSENRAMSAEVGEKIIIKDKDVKKFYREVAR